MKVLVNSLPKSGTHVLTQLMDLLNYAQEQTHYSSSMLSRTHKNPFKNIYKSIQTGNNINGVWIDLEKERCMKKYYFEKLFINFKDNYYSQAHLPFSSTLHELMLGYDIRMIFIIRDPRDVLLSYYHHHKSDPKYQGYDVLNAERNFSEGIRKAIYGFNEFSENQVASLKDRVSRSMGWYLNDLINVLPIKFENLIGHKGGGDRDSQLKELYRIADFLEINRQDVASVRDEIFSKKSSTFRKGKIGSWKDEMDSGLRDELNDELEEILKKLEYIK